MYRRHVCMCLCCTTCVFMCVCRVKNIASLYLCFVCQKYVFTSTEIVEISYKNIKNVVIFVPINSVLTI